MEVLAPEGHHVVDHRTRPRVMILVPLNSPVGDCLDIFARHFRRLYRPSIRRQAHQRLDRKQFVEIRQSPTFWPHHGHWPHLDCLVNNAGFQRESPSEALDVETYRRILDVNLTGPCSARRRRSRILSAVAPAPEVMAHG